MSHELPTLYQQSITKTKYSRWDAKKGRRETWQESVDRLVIFYADHLESKFGVALSDDEFDELHSSILGLDVSPSMRAMMTAGPALQRDNVAAYNCAFMNIDRIKAFSEALYILCCGTGVGFSVERQHVAKLPEVPSELHPSPTTIVVPDSKIGWATSFHELLSLLWAGKIPNIDPSNIRPAGSPLKTFGGRASGPGPLMDLFNYTISVFRNARGRKLNSDEVHGIICKIGDIVVVGGVRRSALISLFNPSDERMLSAKTGHFPDHFHLANNSAAWTEKPNAERFLHKWSALVESKSGEPGIFNRKAAKRKAESIGRDSDYEFGTNPCGEIILRDMQFCNLTEVTVRADDTLETLRRKVVSPLFWARSSPASRNFVI
jgi:ribonucleoside-triphosphate reductase